MMYQNILLDVALQQDNGISGHALAARKVALSIARGSGAKLTVLIGYDYDSLDLSLSLPAEDLSRYRDTQRAWLCVGYFLSPLLWQLLSRIQSSSASPTPTYFL
jgi:hypothetical protein